MAEQRRRLIISGHRGGMTNWAGVEIAAEILDKQRSEHERKHRKAEPVRPPLIDEERKDG